MPELHPDHILNSSALHSGLTVKFVGAGSVKLAAGGVRSAMLAAGAMLTQGKRIEARQLWAGSPARFVRELDDAAIMGMRLGVAHYVLNAKAHAAAISEA